VISVRQEQLAEQQHLGALVRSYQTTNRSQCIALHAKGFVACVIESMVITALHWEDILSISGSDPTTLVTRKGEQIVLSNAFKERESLHAHIEQEVNRVRRERAEEQYLGAFSSEHHTPDKSQSVYVYEEGLVVYTVNGLMMTLHWEDILSLFGSQPTILMTRKSEQIVLDNQLFMIKKLRKRIQQKIKRIH